MWKTPTMAIRGLIRLSFQAVNLKNQLWFRAQASRPVGSQ
jgi:hypothetical protein